jgi:hypothetical protein
VKYIPEASLLSPPVQSHKSVIMRFFRILTAATAVFLPVSALSSPASSDNTATFEALLARDDLTLVPRQDIVGALSGLTDILASIKQFLTAEFLNDVHSVVTDLADLLAPPMGTQTRNILTEATTLLAQVKPILDTLKDIDIKGLVTAALGLLSVDNINLIKNLLTQAGNLLTATFVTQVKTLIGDVQPVS